MPPPEFEILEHPADVGFRAFSESLPGLFAQSALAMLSIAGDPEAAQVLEEYVIRVESGDRESLMVDWLNEVLYWFDGKRIAFHGFEVIGFDDTTIHAKGFGEPRVRECHRSHLIVKAVTYHQLKIEQSGGLWIAEVFLDV
jgi:SHS2 domain-containing protein